MERLTKKISEDAAVYNGEETGYRAYEKMINKLAAFEDADEQGRLDIHPCKESDAVYILRTRQDHYAEEPYMAIEVREYRKSMLKDIGKTVFLTREAAEAALSNKN